MLLGESHPYNFMTSLEAMEQKALKKGREVFSIRARTRDCIPPFTHLGYAVNLC